MRRLFWMGVGAVGAVWLARRARRAVEALPDTVAGQVEQAGERAASALRSAAGQFRSARAAREAELVEALLVEPAGGTERRPRTARTPGSAGPDEPWSSAGPDDEDDDF